MKITSNIHINLKGINQHTLRKKCLAHVSRGTIFVVAQSPGNEDELCTLFSVRTERFSHFMFAREPKR